MTKSRISKFKQMKLIDHFIAGATARCAANIVNVNRNSVTLYFNKLRTIILQYLIPEQYFCDEVEVDESYFGGSRKGKRGRGARDKVPVFGILKRGGKVYTQIIKNAKSETLIPIIEEKVMPDRCGV